MTSGPPSPGAPRRVLVTGATGFVGRHTLAPLLEAGFEVHAVGRSQGTPDLRSKGVTFHTADLLDAAATRAVLRAVRPSHVLHLAWYVEHGRFWAALENLDWVGATLSLARAAAEAGVTRFVGTGTCIEYDWSDQAGVQPPGLRKESDTLAPTFLYGEAKAACYRLLSAAAPGLGLSFAWGRLFHLFGPGENPARLVASLIAAMRAGKTAEIGSGRQLRDFMATQDAGAALAALCASNVEGAVNVASGEPVTVGALAQEIAGLVGRSDLLRIGSRPDRPGDPPSMLADVTRLRREVGFAPAATRGQRLSELAG